jgi:hypothetical protein
LFKLSEYISFQNAAKQLLFPVLPQFTEALVEALRVPDGPTSDSGLKMEILKVNILYGVVNLVTRDANNVTSFESMNAVLSEREI